MACETGRIASRNGPFCGLKWAETQSRVVAVVWQMGVEAEINRLLEP